MSRQFFACGGTFFCGGGVCLYDGRDLFNPLRDLGNSCGLSLGCLINLKNRVPNLLHLIGYFRELCGSLIGQLGAFLHVMDRVLNQGSCDKMMKKSACGPC